MKRYLLNLLLYRMIFFAFLHFYSLFFLTADANTWVDISANLFGQSASAVTLNHRNTSILYVAMYGLVFLNQSMPGKSSFQ